MDNEYNEVVEAIVASLVKAINERLEGAATACETSVQEQLLASYGDGAECIASTEACAEMIRSFKVDAAQINVVRE